VQLVVMTLGEDGSEAKVLVAPDAPEAHQALGQGPDGQSQPITQGAAQSQMQDPDRPDPTIVFNPNVGLYDIEADVGPSYGTQRQEAANAFSQIMAQNPAAFQIVGDFWATNSDFPGADELADRLKRGLPPQYKADAPDPQVVAITQQAQQTQQHAQQLLGQADQEIQQLKQQVAVLQAQAKDKSGELVIRDYEAETKRLAAVGSIDPIALQLVVRQLVSDMLDTQLEEKLFSHADLQGALAAKMQPPQPGPEGAGMNGAPAPAQPPGPMQ
jgi:hypothetical protein